VISTTGRVVSNTRQKIHAKTITWKSCLNLSLTGDKLVQKMLRELATLTAQVFHLIDFI
jgi:hypothetical protein